MIGSAAGTLWSTPCEVVKCTFQSGMYTTSVKSAVRSIHKEAGLRGFYQGYTAQVVRDLPLFAIMFGAYEVMHGYYEASLLVKDTSQGGNAIARSHTRPSDLAHAALGCVAGAIAGTVTNPLDVVRTQATMRTWAVDSASTSLSLLPRIFAEQGVRGLMAGTLARASYMGMGAGAFFVAYERSMHGLVPKP